MLSDRPYLREDDYPRERTSVLIWLISGIVAGFVLQQALIRLGPSNPESYAALSAPGMRHGYAWTLLSYSFLHNPGFLPHVIFDVLALYFIGRLVLPVLGTARFLGVYFSAIVAGGLAWLALHWRGGGAPDLVGATAGIDALLVVFACFYPMQRVEMLLFFVAPIRLTTKQVAFAVIAFDAIGLVYEIRGSGPILTPWPFAHSSHLAGALAGWIYFRYFHETRMQAASRVPEVEVAAVAKQGEREIGGTAYQLSLSSRTDVRAEVDRILDKINSQGLGALSPEEKRFLDEAKDGLNRR